MESAESGTESLARKKGLRDECLVGPLANGLYIE